MKKKEKVTEQLAFVRAEDFIYSVTIGDSTRTESVLLEGADVGVRGKGLPHARHLGACR